MVAAFGFVGSNFASHPTSTSLHSSATKNECQTTSTPMQLISAEKRTEIEKMVRERSEARWHGDYKRADQLRDVIDQICVTIPSNELLQKSIERESDFLEYKVVTADLPRSQGGGSTWELQLVNNPLFSNEKTQDNVLQLAHAVLGMVVSASNRGVDVDEFELNALVSRVEARLQSLKKLKAMSTLFPGTGVAGEQMLHFGCPLLELMMHMTTSTFMMNLQKFLLMSSFGLAVKIVVGLKMFYTLLKGLAWQVL